MSISIKEIYPRVPPFSRGIESVPSRQKYVPVKPSSTENVPERPVPGICSVSIDASIG